MLGKRIAIGGGGGVTADFWSTIAVPGQTSITADINSDVLTLTPGSGIGIQTFPATDTILIYETINISGSVGQHLNDNVPLIFGTDSDSRVVFSTAQLTPTGTLVIGVPDASGGGISSARSLVICDGADVNTDLGLPAQNNPTIVIADASMSKAFLLWNDGTSSHIQSWPSGNTVFHNNLMPSASGTLDIGSPALPFKDLYLEGTSLHLGGVDITSNGSTVTIDGNILPATSGTRDVGSSSLPFQSIYADSFYGDGSNLTGVVSAHSALTGLDYASAGHTGFLPATSGTDIQNQLNTKMPLAGGTFTGDVFYGANNISGTGTVSMGTLNVTTCVTSDLNPCASGTQDIGSAIKPWDEVYVGSVQGVSSDGSGSLVLGNSDAVAASYVEIFDGGEGNPGYVKLYSHDGTPYYLVTASGGGFYVDNTIPAGTSLASWTFSSTILGFGTANISGTGDIYAGDLTVVGDVNIINTTTPTGTVDAIGATGDIGWDDSYLYAKTSSGWKRSTLSTW